MWTKIVNRSEGKNKIWTPQKHDRICSTHFKDGKPTLQNPYPTENLGNSGTPMPSRKPPKTRENLPAKRKQPPTTSK